MTRDRMPAIRERVQQRLSGNADVLYRHTGTFTLGSHKWLCRFSVKDPQKLKADAIADAEAAARQFNVLYRDVRLLRIHPDDQRPVKGAKLPWDGGLLEILDWSQQSDFTGQKVATCVLRR